MITTALPILVPFVFIIVFLFLRSSRLTQWLSLFGSSILVVVSVYLYSRVTSIGIQVLHVGGWKAPFGISLVIDHLSGIMLLATSVIVLSISVYSFSYIEKQFPFSRFYLFFFALIMGVNGAFITGDIFNLYVWFEVILMSSFVLITLGSKKAQLEGGIKYMALNIFGSLLFLAGLGLLYGQTGTLNMAHLAAILREEQHALQVNPATILFFVAFGIKAAVFPLFFWLPASYHTANITITSLFSGLLTKVGVYALIRVFTLFFVQDQHFWHNLILIIAGLTMLVGGLAATSQYETRKILSYHIISQIGYMIMGLGIFTPLAVAGAIFFMVHNMVAKTNTFLISGVISRLKGTYQLKEVGGLFIQNPLLAILFIIPALSLAGFPPLSGFFAKFILFKSGIENHNYLITAAALLTAMLTLYSMTKIWIEAFLKKQPDGTEANPAQNKLSVFDILPSAILGLISVAMGVFAGNFFGMCLEAANNLINPVLYIETMLQ
ncbi:MAG: hypothetical protein JXB34_13480 [Bacteroidales bacterium]|nr:hypothetical protein [Bacteroidales bacterium]